MTEPEATWWWRLELPDGAVLEPEQRTEFPTRSDAESYVGETWRELAASGVAAVTLFEGQRQVYGPMSLSAAP